MNLLSHYLNHALQSLNQGQHATTDLIQALQLVKDGENLGQPDMLTQLIAMNTPLIQPQQFIIGEQSAVSVCPGRGGTVPSLQLGGKEIFYNDPERRNDLSKSVRESFWMGPQAGPFSPDQLAQLGYRLRQHGFLRDIERALDQRAQINDWSEQSDASIFMDVQSSSVTLEQYPHDFIAHQQITIDDAAQSASFRLVAGRSSHVTQRAPGHHTYYRVPAMLKQDIVLDDVLGVTPEMKQTRLSGTDTVVVPNPGSCAVFLPEIGQLELTFDPQFKHLRLWTEPGKDFVCIEPVVANPSAWESEAITLQPGETLGLEFSIQLLDAAEDSDTLVQLDERSILNAA